MSSKTKKTRSPHLRLLITNNTKNTVIDLYNIRVCVCFKKVNKNDWSILVYVYYIVYSIRVYKINNNTVAVNVKFVNAKCGTYFRVNKCLSKQIKGFTSVKLENEIWIKIEWFCRYVNILPTNRQGNCYVR